MLMLPCVGGVLVKVFKQNSVGDAFVQYETFAAGIQSTLVFASTDFAS